VQNYSGKNRATFSLRKLSALSTHWPTPKDGNSRKWLSESKWKKWARNPIVNLEKTHSISSCYLSLIKKMLHVDPNLRPTIEEVISELLVLIKTNSEECYRQIVFLLEQFNSKKSSLQTSDQWPYLYNKWKEFKTRFG
jgi:serine/threonine protein kinase